MTIIKQYKLKIQTFFTYNNNKKHIYGKGQMQNIIIDSNNNGDNNMGL